MRDNVNRGCILWDKDIESSQSKTKWLRESD